MENYQIIRQIGHGTYGDVWLVKCSKTRKKHVLKRIDLQQLTKREQHVAYIGTKLLSTLKHPNLVKYLDSFHNSNGNIFLVTSYCELGNLQDYIKCQNGTYLDEKLIVQWLVQICLALKYLHDKNIIHSNLKTKNIFLTKNEVVKVGNIGISKILSISQEMSPSLIETPYYISPESISGFLLNQKSDIWALGCCMYEITAMKHPYVVRDSYCLLRKIKKKLPSLPEVYSSELYDVISSMLNPVQEKRPCVTNLLLDDYIRKYILLILQGTSKSPYDQYSENSSSLSSGRSKSSSDLTPLLSDPSNGYLVKSKSTNLLPYTNRKKPKLFISSQGFKLNSEKDSVISIPDVNGNADGNDNSQDRLSISYQNRQSLWEDSNKDNDSWCSSSKYSAKSENESQKSSYSAFTNFQKRVKAKQLKKKGEISLQILNYLTYTLQTVRSDKCLNNFHCPVLKPTNSDFESQHAIADSKKLSKKISYGDSYKLDQNGVCVLPKIY